MHYNHCRLRELRVTIGRNIHALRAERNMLLSELAASAKISETMLDRYEIGKHGILLHELLRIACALKIEVWKLLARD
jgi:transcriptional regulator with XRE-family HTH domain